MEEAVELRRRRQRREDDLRTSPSATSTAGSNSTEGVAGDITAFRRFHPPHKRTVCIVVLGDIGRSPRMRYHAESFAKEGFLVTLIGYVGSAGLPSEIENNHSISTVKMSEAPAILQKVPRILAYPLKMAWLSVMLTFAFLWMVVFHQFCPEFILVQNPPAIPSLTLCWLYSKIFACDLIVDWHNYGFSIMRMSLAEDNPMVRFATWCENYFGKKADYHLCVTRAMKNDLNERLGVNAVTLYDRPPAQFKSMTEEEKKLFLAQFCQHYYPELREQLVGDGDGEGRKCGIIVSSTSWTEDEDFGILLSALDVYDKKSSPGEHPELLVFITGKGPLKEYYKGEIQRLKLQRVTFYLPWLEHEHYPKLLGCADLGISLHTSSSGLDLPMKVVDMFGCGLPVCAVNFNCIGELVQHDVNSFVFEDRSELANQIMGWFKGFPERMNGDNTRFRHSLEEFQRLRWHKNWTDNVLPLLKQ